MTQRRISLVRATDQAIRQENAAYLRWRADHQAEAEADDHRNAVLAWRALGWCETCGDPAHQEHPADQPAVIDHPGGLVTGPPPAPAHKVVRMPDGRIIDPLADR